MSTEKNFKLPLEELTELQKMSVDIRAMQEDGRAVEYKEFVSNLFKSMDDDEKNAIHAAMGISGEAGEVLDLIKKTWAYNRSEVDFKKLLNELGDLRFYYQAMLNLIGVSDEDVKAVNIAKLSLRYPKGFYTDKDANARADTSGS